MEALSTLSDDSEEKNEMDDEDGLTINQELVRPAKALNNLISSLQVTNNKTSPKNELTDKNENGNRENIVEYKTITDFFEKQLKTSDYKVILLSLNQLCLKYHRSNGDKAKADDWTHYTDMQNLSLSKRREEGAKFLPPSLSKNRLESGVLYYALASCYPPTFGF